MSILKPPHPADRQVDAVIIGAGVSGLALAETLCAAGLEVVVKESRDRVGGRLLSTVSKPGRLDLGATWFWPGEHRVAKLVQRFDVDVFEQHRAGNAMYHDPSGSQQVNGNPLDVPSFRFVDGADALVRGLESEVGTHRIECSDPVESIRSISGGVRVATASGEIDATHVAVALPPALAVSQIDFGDSLEQRMFGFAALTPVWMGATTKVVIRYKHAFWRDRGLSGSGISHFGPLRELHDMSGPDGRPAALFGFGQRSGEGPSPLETDAVIEQLVSMFGADASEPSEVFAHDWSAEPWTSPPGVERLTSYQTFGHDLYQHPAMDGRLHWCSTETSIENPGHIEGALAAAERAAHAILSHRPISPHLEPST